MKPAYLWVLLFFYYFFFFLLWKLKVSQILHVRIAWHENLTLRQLQVSLTLLLVFITLLPLLFDVLPMTTG